MTSVDSLAERHAYLDGDLTPVRCESCGILVRARKSSAMQTSVQFAGGACARIAEEAAAGERPAALVPTCPDLRDSLDSAVRSGHLAVT